MSAASRAPGAAPRHVALLALAVVALALIRGVLLAVLIPPLQAPDEDAHVDAVQFLGETGTLPPGGACDAVSAETRAVAAVAFEVAFHADRRLPPPTALRLPPPTSEARRTPGCGPADAYPPVYYATAAAAYRAVHDAPFLRRVLAARLASVAWGCAGALAAFLFGWWALGCARDGALLGLLWSTQPMIGLLTATVNNDAALFALGAAGFAAVAALARGAPPLRALPALAALALLGALTKPTFLGVIPLLLGATALALGARRPRAWGVAAAALAPALLALVLWQLRAPPPPGMRPPLPVARYLASAVLDRVRLEYLWVKLYWMGWGWVDTFLSTPWYRLLEALLAAAALGALLGWRELSARERAVLVLGAAATAAQVAFLYAVEWRMGSLVLQGRYLLPVFVPQAAAIVVALRGLGRRLHARVDAGWALALTLLLVQVAAVARTVARYHA